jgi:hypothetical protein
VLRVNTNVATSAVRARVTAGLCAAVIVLLCDSPSEAGRAWTAFAMRARPAQAEKPVDSGVRDALRQYETALESLDADAVKKIQPSIDVEGLKRAFREMRALEVDIDNIKLLSSDTTLTRVSCRVAQTLTPKAGSRQTTTVTRVLRLRRQGSAWIIDAFER